MNRKPRVAESANNKVRFDNNVETHLFECKVCQCFRCEDMTQKNLQKKNLRFSRFFPMKISSWKEEKNKKKKKPEKWTHFFLFFFCNVSFLKELPTFAFKHTKKNLKKKKK